MRTTVDIDPTLLKRLRDEAHRRGVPFKDLLTSVIRRGLDERREKVRPFRMPTYAMGEPLGGVDLTKALRVAEALRDADSVERRSR
jgi:hypothetical protein